MDNSSEVSYKGKHALPYDSAKLLLCAYSSEMKNYVCVQIFIVALFIIVKNWRAKTNVLYLVNL